MVYTLLDALPLDANNFLDDAHVDKDVMDIFADDNSSHVGVAVGVVLAVLAVLGLLTGAVWFLKSRQLLGRKHPGGVAFENPSYLRELNMDHMQVKI